VAGLLLAFV
jgi:hypothetical protein